MKKNIKKDSVTKNYIYNFLYQLLINFIPLITTPYLSRVLGAEPIGTFGYTLSIVTYFILFGTLGIATYAQREIAYHQDNVKERSKTFWEIFIFRLITMGFSMTIFFFTFIFRENSYRIYYYIFSIQLFANCIDISWLFQGMEKFKLTVIRNSIVKILTLALIFMFVKSQADLSKYIFIYCISTFLGNVTLWIYLPVYIEKVKMKELKIFKHFKPTIQLFIPQVAIQIYTVLDKTMIGSILQNKAEVGYYEQPEKIIKICLSLISSLGTVMLPRMANAFANHEEEKMTTAMENSLLFVSFIGMPMTFGCLSIANDFIPLFLGDEFIKSISIFKVLSMIIVIVGFGSIIGAQYLLPTKQQRKYTVAVIVGAFTNFGLNIIFIKWIGVIGAAIATVLAESAVTFIMLFFIRKKINIKLVVKKSLVYIIGSIFILLICMILNFIIKIVTIRILMKVLLGSLIYIIYLTIIKDEILIKIINKIIPKLKIIYKF